jgi:hypothetical protein
MGLIAVSSIFADVRNTLNDEGSVLRWEDADLINYYNDAINQLALVRPDSTAVLATLSLVAGTKQALPAGGLRLIKATRNMGAGGATPGAPVYRGDELSLGLFKPDWHSQAAVAAPTTYLYDDRDPKTIWCEPPSDGTGKWEIVHSTIPTALTAASLAAGALVSVDDVYVGAVKQWMWHRAFGVEISSLSSQNLSRNYERAFYQSLGVKYQGDRAVSPNTPQPMTQIVAGGA